MNEIVNIAGYKFVTLGDLKKRRQDLRALCVRLDLKGTILVSKEGINLFLAGGREAIDDFLQVLRAESEFTDFHVKESFSDRQPFTRMLVRLKQEIIAFGIDDVDPVGRPSKRVSAKELKQWLDAGRKVTLFDTRNDYEVELGTFKNAVPAGIDDFRHFPKAVEQLPESLKEETVVTFCTGGIRCEKAAPFMENAGFKDVYQLDGGILKYFEEVGGEHYDGDCFVFDQRVALDSSLAESEAEQCFACQATLTPEDCRSEFYVEGKSCPRCYKTEEERLALLIEKRHGLIAEKIDPLPGSLPYINRRPMRVHKKQAGLKVIDFLLSLRTIRSQEEWEEICGKKQVLINEEPVGADRVLRGGECLILLVPGTVEPGVNANIQVVFEDDALVVINKPAPIPMHAGGRFNRNSLHHILDDVFKPWALRSAHRLDANTTGALLYSKSRRIAAEVQQQFEQGKVEKRYLARVTGMPAAEQFESRAPISRGPAPAGGRTVDPEGLSAHTEFKVLRAFEDGTHLVEARPRTGRTNQIRVHLWHLGLPVVGDPLYLADRRFGERQTLELTDPPLCLHSASLTIRHPLLKKRVTFDAPSPEWSAAETW